jgi:hypothetical protein
MKEKQQRHNKTEGGSDVFFFLKLSVFTFCFTCRFVEIMATVFSRDAWRCVWHMIQNDLVHGWGLDFALRRCVEPAHEKIGVVDSQWVIHQVIPSLGNQGTAENGRTPWEGVRARCRKEWGMFQKRLADAEKAYYLGKGITPPN